MKLRTTNLQIQTSNHTQPGLISLPPFTSQPPRRSGALARTIGAATVLFLGGVSALAAGDDPFVKREPPAVVGRWDLVVRGSEREYPSWLEVSQSGYRTLVGSYVGQFGSARPIGQIEEDQGRIHFALPPQWERRPNDVVFDAKLEGDVLRGEVTDDQGKRIHFEGRRAPSLQREQPPKWGPPIELFNARDLAGWKPRHPEAKHGWLVQGGLLTNAIPGNDLLTERNFTDFKLHAEFRYPKKSNSGIYLRGRYEVQIEDNFGLPPDAHRIGGVYGFLTPSVNAAKTPGEWQTMEITLVGRLVTVVLNGERIIERQTIPGITGGALDSDEAKPGPILLQGDHGPIAFRKLILTPAK